MVAAQGGEAVSSKVRVAIGLMSGTSLDGVDAAILETDGLNIVTPGKSLSVAYTAEERQLFRLALDHAREWAQGAPVPEAVAEAERHITFAHIRAVKALLAEAGLAAGEVDIVGFHGQTVLHRPEDRRTVQIGLGDVLASMLGIDVISDFRSADVAAGGQGAPFAPLYHAARVAASGQIGPVAVLNIGGVGNVTFIDGEEIVAFDTGPGNALIDDWALTHLGEPLDRDGHLAAAGDVRPEILSALMDHAYFAAPPPKSLDRLSFMAPDVAPLSPADGAATLTAFTAMSVARAVEHLPAEPETWIVCGGGRHNPTLLSRLQEALPGVVRRAEDLGWRGDDIEAEAFAYLAVRSLDGRPLSLPSTTGVPEPMTGGRLHKGRR